jgi:S-adenosylmethionine/arginine decarboxylase-like enzyme
MLYHEHFIGRFEVKSPPLKGTGFYLETWMRRLIKSIGMELLNGPHLSYVTDPGNRGWTGVAIIKTSHCALHVWEEPNPAIMQFDCYSCAKLDPEIVISAFDEFNPSSYQWAFLDRDNGIRWVRGGADFHEDAFLGGR